MAVIKSKLLTCPTRPFGSSLRSLSSPFYTRLPLLFMSQPHGASATSSEVHPFSPGLAFAPPAFLTLRLLPFLRLPFSLLQRSFSDPPCHIRPPRSRPAEHCHTCHFTLMRELCFQSPSGAFTRARIVLSIICKVA